MRAGRRLPVMALLAVAIAAAAVADRADRPDRETLVSRPAPMPVAAAADALSATWYCPGGSATERGAADVAVVLANTGREERQATVTVVPSEGDPQAESVEMPAFSRTLLRLQESVEAPYAAAVVEVDGGEVVVEQVATGPLGFDTAPCASAPSERWHFAEGSTVREATLLLSLFNPFPEDAIADVSFSTDQGRAVPAALQGVVVPARGLVVVNVTEHVRRREMLATTVVARKGRLVAQQVQLHDGGGRRGLGLTPGTPEPRTVWYFPEGFTAPGIVERVHVYNPDPVREAQVDVEPTLEQGAAEPFELAVPPRGRVVLSLNDESRIPPEVAHALIVRAFNDVPVVVARTFDATSPATRSGFASTVGSAMTSARWALAAGGANEGLDEWVVVHNIGLRDVSVSFIGLARQQLAVEGLQDVEVGAGRRRAFRIGDHIRRDELSLIVEASGPVVVERALYRVGSTGIAAAIGIPLPESAG